MGLREVTDEHRTLPSMGHHFNQLELRCLCGLDWESHQRKGEPCPVKAREAKTGKRAKQCKRGHVYTDADTRPDGSRRCIRCRDENYQRHIEAKRERRARGDE